MEKWSFNSIQISNLNRKSACKTNGPFNQSFLFRLTEMKIERLVGKYQPEYILCAGLWGKLNVFSHNDVEVFR